MNKHEEFSRKVQENKIEKAHTQALFAEKTAKVLSKQALKLISRGEEEATADRPLSRKLNPNSWIGDNVYEDEDLHSMQLATNATLKKDGIKVKITEGFYEPMNGKATDSITISTFDNSKDIIDSPVDKE